MKFFRIAIILSIAAILAACGSNKEENAEPVRTKELASSPVSATPTEPTSTETAAPAETREVSPSPSSGEAIDVDKGLFSNEITFPASFFGDTDEQTVIANAKAEGINEVKKNEDGSYTYKMSKSVYDKLLKETKEASIEFIEGIKENGEYPSVKEIEYDDKLTEFTLVVDKTSYETGLQGMAALGISLSAMMYQTVSGVEQDKLKVTVHAKDEKTDEVFRTVVYPDVLNTNS